MISMVRSLIVPAFTVLALAFAPSADAAFSVSTSITGDSAGGFTSTPGGGFSSSISIFGTTISFNDYSTTNNATGAIPSEAYTLTGAYTGPATGTAISISENILITNGGSTGTFTETSNFTLFSFGLVSGGATVTPTSQSIGGTTFNIIASNASSAQFGQTVNNGAISATVIASAVAVPEPASIAMLGLGLIGSVGFAARRRLARA